MSRWSEEFLESMRQEMDPLADSCVRALFEDGGARVVASFQGKLVDEAGEPMAGLPPAMVEYLNQTAGRPLWIDDRKLQIGAKTLNSHGVLVLLLCGCGSLPECYADKLGMPVLFLTQQLNVDINRRIAETILFVKYVLSTDGFGPTGRGLDAARKVRLMHAAVRYLMLNASDEKLAAGLPPGAAAVFRDCTWEQSLGQPINQEDLAYTLQTFAWVIVRGLRQFHVGLQPEEEDAIIHCWNVAGLALGVRQDLLPESVDEAEELFTSIKKRVEGESEEGKSLTAAVLDFAATRIPWEHYASAPEVLSRYLVGDPTADMVGMPPISWHQKWDQRRWVLEVSIIAHVREHRLDALPFMRRWSMKLFQFVLGRRLKRRMTEVPFAIPTALADNWSLNTLEKG